MDVIFCRNVLMYFTPDRAQAVARNFYRALVDGGWLIVSPVETSSVLFAPFTAVAFPGATLYQKTVEAEPGVGLVKETSSVLVVPPAAWTPPIIPSRTVEAAQTAPIAKPPASLTDHTALADNARDSANQGKLDDALAWCAKAIAADKLNPAHYYLFAVIQQEQGQVNAAAQALHHALYLDPDFVLAHFALGNLRLAQGKQREAARHFGNAGALLQQYPRDKALPEWDGMTAGRLVEIIASIMSNLPQPTVADV